MNNSLVTRCVWLVDTIRRYGRITRRELEAAWLRSDLSEGKPLTRRTLANHREAAERIFNINIECDPATYEYYIETESDNKESVTEWLLDSVSLHDVLSGATDATDRIFVENVPSARLFLGTAIDCIRGHRRMKFDYHPYTRSNPTTGVVLEPYFVKLFKQRWYLVGRNVADQKVKTYALDRVRNALSMTDTFKDDPAFDIQGYFKNAFGIVVTDTPVKEVVIKTDTRQAKYFRALPLHHSQHETVGNGYSLFSYRMLVTADLVSELLSHGQAITVLDPPELRAMMLSALKNTLDNYK